MGLGPEVFSPKVNPKYHSYCPCCKGAGMFHHPSTKRSTLEDLYTFFERDHWTSGPLKTFSVWKQVDEFKKDADYGWRDVPVKFTSATRWWRGDSFIDIVLTEDPHWFHYAAGSMENGKPRKHTAGEGSMLFPKAELDHWIWVAHGQTLDEPYPITAKD